jgi:hypothetical protein
VKLPDGSLQLPPVMRRKVNGEWDYRRLTLAEEQDYVSQTAW